MIFRRPMQGRLPETTHNQAGNDPLFLNTKTENQGGLFKDGHYYPLPAGSSCPLLCFNCLAINIHAPDLVSEMDKTENELL